MKNEPVVGTLQSFLRSLMVSCYARRFDSQEGRNNLTLSEVVFYGKFRELKEIIMI